MKLFYLNASANKRAVKGRTGFSDSDKNIITAHIKNEKPDIIVLSEFSYSKNIKDILEENSYQVEVSNEDINSKETCLILIAWKKTSLKGMRLKEKPKVLANRFLGVVFANNLKIIGVHIPGAYPYKNTGSEEEIIKSLEDRINKEIEPFRKYINNINDDDYTMIVGDFNPYNKRNDYLRILTNEQRIRLTDSKRKLEEKGWKSIFDAPTHDNNKQLDFVFVSNKLFEDTKFSFKIKESGFSDHKIVIINF